MRVPRMRRKRGAIVGKSHHRLLPDRSSFQEGKQRRVLGWGLEFKFEGAPGKTLLLLEQC